LEGCVLENIRSRTEKALRAAGKLIMAAELDKKDIVVKGIGNFVTQVDYAVQEYLLEELAVILPGSAVIAEEAEPCSYHPDMPTWILDPVDGTTNLMRGYRHSAISLGLFDGGKPWMGFIYNPYTEEMFFGEKGKGAYLNGTSIFVNPCAALEDCLLAFGTTPYDKSKAEKTFRITEALFRRCLDVRRTGSAALDIAYVAAGRVDGFYELNLQPWDFAAGIVILEEAGGRITSWQGEGLEKLVPGSVLATNGRIHNHLQPLLLAAWTEV
jgi:myo-inositol-1(or 4)-monophosphatase